MAVIIVDDLRGTPKSTALPATITLRQTLKSNLSSEQVKIVYSLSSKNNVVFGSGKKKTDPKEESVSRAGTEIVHTVRLQKSSEGEPKDWVGISQTLTDEDGGVTDDSTRIVIK